MFVGVEKSIFEVFMLVLLVNLVTAASRVAGEVVANVTVSSFLPVECVLKGNYHFTTDLLKNLGTCLPPDFISRDLCRNG
jgi:hypoxanthine-guanine phosphoribosyltransferase